MKDMVKYKCNLKLRSTPFFVAGFSYCVAAFATQVCYSTGDFSVTDVLQLAEFSRLLLICLCVFATVLVCYVLVPPYCKDTLVYAYSCEVYDYSPGTDYPILRFRTEAPDGAVVYAEKEVTPPERAPQDRITLPVYGTYANFIAVSQEFAQDELITCAQTAPDRWVFKRYVQATALTTVSKKVNILLQTCMWFAYSNFFYVMTVIDLTLNTAINRICFAIIAMFVFVLPFLCRSIKTVFNRDKYLRNRAKRKREQIH